MIDGAFFSVIVPMYNVSDFIERCLNSVFLAGEHATVPYELIIVNDGSTDSSEEKAREICEGRNNVKLISQINLGLGGARNTGIKASKGKYIIFLDSDDVVKKEIFSQLYAENENADIIEYGYYTFNDHHEKRTTFEESLTNDGITYFFNSSTINSACNKAYSAEFLKRENLTFKEKIYGEDIEFNIRAILVAKRVKSISPMLSAFYENPKSITRGNDPSKHIKYMFDLAQTIQSTKSLLDANIDNTDKVRYLRYRLTSLNTNTLLFILQNKIPQEQAFKYLELINGSDALIMTAPLKKREIFRKLLKNGNIRTFVFKLLLK